MRDDGRGRKDRGASGMKCIIKWKNILTIGLSTDSGPLRDVVGYADQMGHAEP